MRPWEFPDGAPAAPDHRPPEFKARPSLGLPGHARVAVLESVMLRLRAAADAARVTPGAAPAIREAVARWFERETEDSRCKLLSARARVPK